MIKRGIRHRARLACALGLVAIAVTIGVVWVGSSATAGPPPAGPIAKRADVPDALLRGLVLLDRGLAKLISGVQDGTLSAGSSPRPGRRGAGCRCPPRCAS